MAYIGNTPDVNSFAAGSDKFSGNGSTTKFVLSRRVVGVNDVIAIIENVIQDPFTAYTMAANNTSGTADITFTSAPPSGTDNIQVRYNYAQIVTYDVIDGNNILGGTVSGSKIADGAVTATKLAATAVTPGTYGGAEQIPVIVVDQQGRLTSAANASISAPLPNILMLSGM